MQDNHSDIKRHKATGSLKLLWLNKLVETKTKDCGSQHCVHLYLLTCKLFSYTKDRVIVWLACSEAKVSCDFTLRKDLGLLKKTSQSKSPYGGSVQVMKNSTREWNKSLSKGIKH